MDQLKWYILTIMYQVVLISQAKGNRLSVKGPLVRAVWLAIKDTWCWRGRRMRIKHILPHISHTDTWQSCSTTQSVDTWHHYKHSCSNHCWFVSTNLNVGLQSKKGSFLKIRCQKTSKLSRSWAEEKKRSIRWWDPVRRDEGMRKWEVRLNVNLWYNVD